MATQLQCSCLENPRDGGAWWAAVYGVTESDTTDATQQQQRQGMTTPTNQPDVLLFRFYCIAIFCFYAFPMVIFSWLSQSNRQLTVNPCISLFLFLWQKICLSRKFVLHEFSEGFSRASED